MAANSRRSGPGNTFRSSSTSRTGTDSRASTPCPPRPSAPGCRSPCAGCVARTAPRTAGCPPTCTTICGTVTCWTSAHRPATSCSTLRTDRCCWPARGPASPPCCRSSNTSPAPSPNAPSSWRTPTGPHRTTPCGTPCCTSPGTSTTSPPTPGTKPSTAADDRSQQGLMDLSQIPLPDGIQVFTCGPLPFMRHVRSDLLARGVPASADPVRGLRTRPVGGAGGGGAGHRIGQGIGTGLTPGPGPPPAGVLSSPRVRRCRARHNTGPRPDQGGRRPVRRRHGRQRREVPRDSSRRSARCDRGRGRRTGS